MNTTNHNSAAAEQPVLSIKEGKVVPTAKLTKSLFDLLNAGFYVKMNEQKGGITANRYGKKGDLRVQLLADKVIVSEPRQAPSVVGYDEYPEMIKAA